MSRWLDQLPNLQLEFYPFIFQPFNLHNSILLITDRQKQQQMKQKTQPISHSAQNSAVSRKNLFMKDSVQGSVLIDVKCLLVPQIFNADGLSWVKAKPFSQLFHFIIEEVDLLLTAIDALCVLLHFPDKCSQQASVTHSHVSLTAAMTTCKLVFM